MPKCNIRPKRRSPADPAGKPDASNALSIPLPTQQQSALNLLRDGAAFGDAANHVGIDRRTLYRWLNTNPNFRAAYNQWQEELKEWHRARLLKLSDPAMDAVERDLRRGNGKLGMRFLEKIGLLAPPKALLTEPENVRRQMHIDAEQDRMVPEKEQRDLQAIKQDWRNEDANRLEEGAAGNLDHVPTDDLIDMARKNDPEKWGREP